MEVAYLYSKTRSEFGKPCNFSDGETQVVESILPTNEYDEYYKMRNPSVASTSTAPRMSETEVNTDRVVTTSTSMRHTEGGWPKDVDVTEQSDVTRFRKKAEKDESYQNAIKILGPIVERCMKQNNTVDIYEQYFKNEDTEDLSSEPPSAKGLAVFRDPSPIQRSASSINWHPEANSSKIAVSYSIPRFQDERFKDPKLSLSSYLWDINNSNRPIVELAPPSHITCLRFNPKSTDTLVGGCYNGLITYFDLRKPNGPAGQCNSLETSLVENSHHDPVSDVFWISSKTGYQCASVSTGGKMLWWDTRKLSEPIDSIVFTAQDADNKVTLGGSALEYNTEAGPTKYLIGTEQGSVLGVNLRNRKINNGVTSYDNGPGKHHGPIYSIQRNPTHHKFFMTVGDWSAKIWAEDLKTPIITTKFNGNYLTRGCWSPTRPGVLYVTGMDGVLNVWDFYHRQDEVAYTHKVGNIALTSIAVQGNVQSGGKLVAVGDIGGSTSLLEVCDSLCVAPKDEKATINSIFERETRREKNLEVREREMKRAKALREEKRKSISSDNNDESEMEDILKKIDDEFAAMLQDNSKDESP